MKPRQERLAVVPRQDRNTLFRRQALASLDDIDELDRLVTVTHPRAWLTLGAVAALIVAALIWASIGSVTSTVSCDGILLAGPYVTRVTTLEGGQLERLDVNLGETIVAGQTVATLQTGTDGAGDPASAAVVSPYEGRVVSLQAYPGQYLTPGAPVLTVEPTDAPLLATLYLPVDLGAHVRAGQEVEIMPTDVDVETYGFIPGRVVSVADMPSTPESMQAVLQNEFLVQQFSAAGPVIRVEATLSRDPATFSGYAWSSSDGPQMKLPGGTTCTARIVLERVAPITYAFPSLGQMQGGGE